MWSRKGFRCFHGWNISQSFAALEQIHCRTRVDGEDDGGPVYIIQLTPRAISRRTAGTGLPLRARSGWMESDGWSQSSNRRRREAGASPWNSTWACERHLLASGTNYGGIRCSQRKDESQDEPGSRRQALPRKGTISMTYSDYQ